MANQSIFSYDNTLPGVITEIHSTLSSEYDTSLFGTTDSVCIIGTAFDGPVGTPVPVYSVEHATYTFGKPYDSETRREASLVAGIQDAWDHGCRTIYAMRINGKDMYKDFEFNIDTDYKLRVQSRYPSNLGKQVYVKFDNTPNAEVFTIYKPASRATIREKMAGLVEDANSVMVNEIRVAQDYGYTVDTKLVDVIDLINNHQYNNVVELQIVDADGNVVTQDSSVYDLTLGCLFPGVYFMGRGDSLVDKKTSVTTNFIFSKEDPVPFNGFEGNYYNTLVMNTDVAQPYPIYYTDLKEMRTLLEKVGITMETADDYLEDADVSNKAFPEDEIDYEESELSAFEKYLKLGSGFAITAVAERRVDGDENELIPKVKEAPLDDVNRIVPTDDGIYSVLEDTKIRYHVLGHDICADTVIGGKIPKYTEFKTTLPNSVEMMNGLISVTSKVDSDNAYTPEEYMFMMYDYKTPPAITKDNLFTGKTVEIVGFADEASKITSVTDARPGDKAILIGDAPVLYVANNDGVYEETQDPKYAGEYVDEGVTKYGGHIYLAGMTPLVAGYEENKITFTPVTEDNNTDFTDGKPYVVMQNNGDTQLFITDMSNPFTTMPFMATVDAAMNQDEDQLFVYYQNHGVGTNYIMISYPHFDTLPLNDYVEMLNDSAVGDLFTFELTQAGRILRDEYVTDADRQAAEDNSGTPALSTMANVVLKADRTRGYDYSKHIPYYTSDNFARHLAQHCTYTELKTYPTHGIIGFERISDMSKTNLAKKVQEVKDFNWNMYVKNNYGRNMLDKDNLPYSIGRNVSATLFQDRVVSSNNYTTICNGASAYAGMISSLDIGQSSTGQTIDLTPMFEFSRAQLQDLTDLGIVTVKNSFTQGYVITDGVTMADNTDLLRRLFNTRVMHFVEDYIRAVCEPFIGKANSSANRNSLQTALNSRLSELVDTLLRSYEFKIVDDGTADQYTYIDINYTIVPMNEIREIRNYIRVQN